MDNLLENRHSARSFSSKPVDTHTIIDIITKAQLAPSWGNAQSYHVYIANGGLAKEIRQEHYAKVVAGKKSFADFYPNRDQNFNKAGLDNLADFNQQLDSLGKEAKQKFWDMNSNLFNAPVLVYISVPKKSTAYGHYDAGALGYGILLAAEENGLRGIPAYEIIRYASEIRKHFTIPENERILMGIALGYPENEEINTFNPGRQNIDDLLTLKTHDRV